MFDTTTSSDLSVPYHEMFDMAYGTQGLDRIIYAAEWHVNDTVIGRIGLISVLCDLFSELARPFLEGLVDLLIGDDEDVFLFHEERSGQLSRHQPV